jgi:hypothetical protein
MNLSWSSVMKTGSAKIAIPAQNTTKRTAWKSLMRGEKTMDKAQKLDEYTGIFVEMLLKEKPERATCVHILRKVRTVFSGNKSPFISEFRRRVRDLIHIEAKWQKRKDWERKMMQAWGGSVN